MIKPTKFYAKNYKAYKEVNLDVGKFNVFIGKNSAGKSALARLAPLILKSLNVGSDNVIDFAPLGIDIGASYQDIVHGHNEYTRLELGASFDCDGEDISFFTELIFSTELKALLVSKFNAVIKNETYQAELDLEGLEKNGNVNYLSNGKKQEIVFEGLIPKTTEDNNIFALLEMVRLHNFDISYLGPFRSELQRTYTTKAIKNLEVGDKGQNAPFIFKAIDFKSNGVLSNKIKEWMYSNFDGKYFSLRSCEQSFSVVCSGQYNESNIIDEGMGFAQIFPSIINRSVRDLKKIKGIEIIEQPELHIHPAACGTVADLYLNARNSNVIFVETHSKEFVLRVRRRIAEGIDSDDVNINYIDYDVDNKTARLTPIKVDDKGAVDWWPKGIFEEDFDEVIALAMASSSK